MMRRLIFAAVLLAFAIPLAGQSGNEGSIMGTVSDPSGAVVADALVTARHTETASTYSTGTDQGGTFRFLVLPVGTYDIKVERSGFTTEIERGVILSLGAKSNVDFSLKVAGPSETVSAASSLIEISRSSVTSTIDPRLVAELPVNGRNFFSLVLLTPGVTAIGNFYSFQGQPAMNSLLVDGANQNSFTQEPVGSAAANRYAFSQEAIQEFQVQSSTYSAEFGGSAGGIIHVVTKSGTNA